MVRTKDERQMEEGERGNRQSLSENFQGSWSSSLSTFNT